MLTMLAHVDQETGAAGIVLLVAVALTAYLLGCASALAAQGRIANAIRRARGESDGAA